MPSFSIYLSVAYLLLLGHPSIKEVSDYDYKVRFAGQEPELSFACYSEAKDELQSLSFSYDVEMEQLSCNCPEGSYLKISSKLEPAIQEYINTVNTKALSEFMEMQNLQPLKFLVYTHNYEVELIFQTLSAGGDMQYWQYQNKN